MDLKAFVPAILFKDNEKSGQGKNKDDGKGALDMSHTQEFFFFCFRRCCC